MSGSFTKQTLETNGKANIALKGSFRPNGSSATAAANIRANWISSVAHTATGIYTITMKDAFKNLRGPVSCIVSLRMGSAALSWARGGAYSKANGTLVVYTFTEASDTTASADIASHADSWIDIDLTVQMSAIVDGNKTHNA